MSNTKRLTGIAIFSALVIILQLLSTFSSRIVPFLPFNITLTLIPIVVGAAVYGIRTGAFLGGVFGVVVLVACIFGWDPGGNVLWNANPMLTAALCLVKGIAAGFMAGLFYSLFAKKSRDLGVICAAIISPLVNTGIFCAAFVLFYHDTLVEWAAGTPALSYMIFTLAGINLLIELGSNIILSPIVSRILRIKAKLN